MNICIKDIYQIILSLIVLYLLYSKIYDKNEKFQNTTTGYQADIEAIRNLSSIAQQLNGSNSLTMPGILNVNNLYTKGAKNNNPNGAITHFPYTDGNNYIRGDTIVNGNINLEGILKIGSWLIRDKNNHLQFIKDGTAYNDVYGKIPDDQGFLAMSQDGNIWTNRATGRGWICDTKLNTSGGTITGNLIMNGKIAMNDNPIVLRGINDPNHYIKFSSATDGPEIGGCGGINITRPCDTQKPLIKLGNFNIWNDDKELIMGKLDRSGGIKVNIEAGGCDRLKYANNARYFDC